MTVALDDGLFPAPEPVAAAEAPPTTVGERRRARQMAAIALGQHPLTAALRFPIALHPQARRDGDRDDPAAPRCGGCALRQFRSGGNKNYPKCLAGPVAKVSNPVHVGGEPWRWTWYPRATNGGGTDVAAWFPACIDFVPKES